MRIWSRDPHCAMCGKLVDLAYKSSNPFELDHIKAVIDDGSNDDDNLQILCCGPGSNECHAKKTAQDLGHREPVRIGLDGFPIDS